MSDYIKREDAMKALKSVVWSSTADHTKRNILASVIKRIPTADVVEVIRCKNCIYKEECGREVLVNEYDDDKAVDITGFLFYCSYGERAK